MHCVVAVLVHTPSKGQVRLCDDCAAPQVMKTVLVTEGPITSLYCGNWSYNDVAVQYNHLCAKPQIRGQEVRKKEKQTELKKID